MTFSARNLQIGDFVRIRKTAANMAATNALPEWIDCKVIGKYPACVLLERETRNGTKRRITMDYRKLSSCGRVVRIY